MKNDEIEMWDAISQIPDDDPNKDFAIAQAREIRLKLQSEESDQFKNQVLNIIKENLFLHIDANNGGDYYKRTTRLTVRLMLNISGTESVEICNSAVVIDC